MSSMIGLAVIATLADSDFGHMGGHMGDWGSGWWILMMFGMIAFWGLVVFGIVWMVRESSGRGKHDPGDKSLLDILDRRLAKGEISPEEYEERRRILKGAPQSE